MDNIAYIQASETEEEFNYRVRGFDLQFKQEMLAQWKAAPNKIEENKIEEEETLDEF
jgi:hypothetical protein